MSSQKKLIALSIAVALLIFGGLVWLLRGPGAVPLAGNPSQTPASSVPQPITTVPLPPPTTISGELTNPQNGVDHRMVKNEVRAAPKLDFTYALMTTLPAQAAKTVPVHVYRHVDMNYAKDLARKYGLSADAPFIDGTTIVFSDLATEPDAAVFRVNGRSGYSIYELILPPLPSPQGRADAVRVATAFLKKTGQLPSDLDTPLTYQRRSVPGTTYVEFHRSWKPLPILDPAGMLDASAAARSTRRVPDPDIMLSSDKTDGFARADDFNSATVAVDRDGLVTLARVHFRPIQSTLPARALKTPQQAWEDLQKQKTAFGLVLPSLKNPAGLKWEDAFPNGLASSKEARVREVTQAFAEQSKDLRQAYAQPVYLFKGEAKLANGTMADFLVLVSALLDDSLPS